VAEEERMVDYRERSMPGLYWIALALVGGFFYPLILVVTVMDALDGSTFNPLGAIFWGAVLFVVVRVYGTRQAYRLRIVDDSLEWRAPLRRRHVPLTALAAAKLERRRGLSGQWRGHITTTSGETFPVGVRDRRQARRFVGFCEAVRLRVPDFTPPAELP